MKNIVRTTNHKLFMYRVGVNIGCIGRRYLYWVLVSDSDEGVNSKRKEQLSWSENQWHHPWVLSSWRRSLTVLHPGHPISTLYLPTSSLLPMFVLYFSFIILFLLLQLLPFLILSVCDSFPLQFTDGTFPICPPIPSCGSRFVRTYSIHFIHSHSLTHQLLRLARRPFRNAAEW